MQKIRLICLDPGIRIALAWSTLPCPFCSYPGSIPLNTAAYGPLRPALSGKRKPNGHDPAWLLKIQFSDQVKVQV
jgi:hypothetical protein